MSDVAKPSVRVRATVLVLWFQGFGLGFGLGLELGLGSELERRGKALPPAAAILGHHVP